MALPRPTARSSRTLDNLKTSTDTLSGADSQALRSFCTSEYLNVTTIDDEYGQSIRNRSLKSLKARFQARCTLIGKEAATQEIFDMRWGPTRVPIYNVMLTLKFMMASVPGSRSDFLNITDFLVKTAEVPVDGADMSGTTALMHAIGTKPYLDTEFAQALLDTGANINRRNRYGETTAHEISKVHAFPAENKTKALEALKWFVDHGGDVDIKDSEGITPRFMITNTAVKQIAPRMVNVLPAGTTSGRRCSACNSNEAYLEKALAACAACKTVSYCSKECQKIDWRRGHKKQCGVAT
ncbi:uncharacterized protein BDZ99DRAFT_493150 [Mytilinidion resinicola]|uniref:MYND-type domain-containing protein n=1 Tax=Mytilinidion resinicola TaxID=574789 RepID=A0A6A6Z8G1_9PEZI|nr:uncharacterized protein BDZ99DRAFT_493150 [Mytilinidion resinicola]KAF2817306.1 hypothetical protein BDZ99DRAFT_493150 [Mytilinidion resinicola]